MWLVNFFFYLFLSLWQVSPYQEPVEDNSTANPVVEDPKEEGPEAAEYLYFFDLELVSPDRLRLVYGGDLARDIYQHLDDALLVDVTETDDGSLITSKASRQISCQELIMAHSPNSYYCVQVLGPDGKALAGFNVDVNLSQAISQNEAADQDILLVLNAETAQTLYQYLDIIALRDPSGRRQEDRKRGGSLECAFRTHEAEPSSTYLCRQLISTDGSLIPYGSGDPIARVGRLVEIDSGNSQDHSLLLPEPLVDNRYGLGPWYDTGSSPSEDETDADDFGLPIF